MIRPPPKPTLFPYTTLSRSPLEGSPASNGVELDAHGGPLAEPRRSLHREALERELRRLARRARVAGPEHDRRADVDGIPLAAVRRLPFVAPAPRERPEAVAA